MKIKITALDTLFFRDGKPFSMGEETWATGQFPPMPSVFYGAIRSLYFSIFPEAFSNIENEDPSENLEINEITLWQSRDRLFPCPSDLVEIKDMEEYQLLQLEDNKTDSSYPLSYLLKSDNQVESLIGKAVLTEDEFKDEYLKGEQPTAVLKLEKFLLSEPKVGIGRNNITRTTEEGQLYRVGLNRLDNKEDGKLEFFIDFNGLDFQEKLPKNGFLKLGAENKVVAYSIIEKPNKEIEEVKIEKQFKLVLTSPAIFKNGWFPDFLNDEFEGDFQGAKVKLIAAATGRAISVGGYDMKNKRPKPMFKALPAGSTFYFEIIDNATITLTDKPLKLNCVKGMEKQGFGIAYIGNIEVQN